MALSEKSIAPSLENSKDTAEGKNLIVDSEAKRKNLIVDSRALAALIEQWRSTGSQAGQA